MSDYKSVERIKSLKQNIESKTGGSYADLTAGVQALADGYGKGSGGSDSATAVDVGMFWTFVPPAREKLESQGFAVHEFTLISTPTGAWDMPNPLGAMPSEMIALFRVDSGLSELINTGYPVYAINTEFVNGTYTNHNTYTLRCSTSTPSMPEQISFSYGSYRWLNKLPDADKIYFRGPENSVIRWQPGEYLLAVK